MRFQNGPNRVAIELRVVQFWSEIIPVISKSRVWFQTKFHSTQLPLLISELIQQIWEPEILLAEPHSGGSNLLFAWFGETPEIIRDQI